MLTFRELLFIMVLAVASTSLFYHLTRRCDYYGNSPARAWDMESELARLNEDAPEQDARACFCLGDCRMVAIRPMGQCYLPNVAMHRWQDLIQRQQVRVLECKGGYSQRTPYVAELEQRAHTYARHFNAEMTQLIRQHRPSSWREESVSALVR